MILEHKGIPVFYTDTGQGKAVVLLHGFLENSSMWEELTPQFSESNRIIAVDLLGHGETGCIGYIHTMEMMAEAVKVVLDNLSIKEATFIGHSMGGYVALAFTEMFPTMVKGLCLMNSTAYADTEERKLNRDRAIAAVKQNHKRFIGMSISNLFAPENRERLISAIEKVKKEACKTPLQGIIAALEGMKIRKDRTDVLNRFLCKKMIVIGRKDPVLDYNVLMGQAKEANIEVLDLAGGHMSHVEDKIELSYKIMHFIEK